MLTSCGNDPQCIEVKRINVSAAFYISIEFQETGYLVVRLYKSAYGDAMGTSTFGGPHQLPVPIVRFNEFLPDTRHIGEGVVVGAPGWEQQLENKKQAFVTEFVQRSRFTPTLPTTMTPAQFVDQLNTNAGNVLSTSERDAAIAFFGGAANTSNMTARAQALRQVAEDQNLRNAEFNRAFVLMQYFGYLRRNPNDPPDTDYSGFDFWLTKLNQFNGNFVQAEMVKAFIISGEYRQRFGQYLTETASLWKVSHTETRSQADSQRSFKAVPERQFKLSTARDCANDVKLFCSRRDLLRQRSVRRQVRYVLATGKESQERPALSRDVLANRPTQHRILCLQCIEDRSSCHFALNLNCHISADACKRPQMRRHYNPNHGPYHDNAWTSTERTGGRSRTIGAQVSPASGDA